MFVKDSISGDVDPHEFTVAIYALQDLDQLLGNQLSVVDGGFLNLRVELAKVTSKVNKYLDLLVDGLPSGGFPIELLALLCFSYHHCVKIAACWETVLGVAGINQEITGRSGMNRLGMITTTFRTKHRCLQRIPHQCCSTSD